MKLIIVEDETDILWGIRDVAESISPSFAEVYAENNAEDAWELILERRPEIIFTDIVLPQMSGLDMLDRVRQIEGYRPKVIVVSSHTNFQYARRSIQLGAIDYILKPFDKQELVQKMATVRRMAEEEAHQLIDQSAYAKIGTEAMQERFLLDLCLFKTPLQEHIHHRLQMWNLSWLTTDSYGAVSFAGRPSHDLPPEDKELQLEHFSIGNIAREIVAQTPSSVIFRNMHNQWIVLTAYSQAHSLSLTIIGQVNKYQKIELLAGISGEHFSFQSLSDAYAQSQQALRVAGIHRESGCLFYHELPPGADSGPRAGSPQQIADRLWDSDEREALAGFQSMVEDYVLKKSVKKISDISVKCFEWICEIHACLSEKAGKPFYQLPMSMWVELDHCADLPELHRCSERHLLDMMRAAAELAGPASNEYIDKAKTIIAERFGDMLTLQDVAEELAIHPVWLSRLFKKVTGQNFLDYVTEIRLSQAKRLLQESHLKVYEVSERVGYQDLQYFGKLFKRQFGMTPKEFRKKK